MKNFIKSKYFTYILAAAFSIAFVAFFIFNPSHAYFQVHKDFIGVNTAKVDLLFDKFAASRNYGGKKIENEDGTTSYEGGINVDLNATWGTPKNPYVIDDTNHISNLSVLQKSGYFNGKDHQCFFVVCTPTGYPVAIDCDGMEIAPIGSPALPFTGSIQGAPKAVSDSQDGNGNFVDPYTGTKFTNVYTVGDNNFTVTQSTIADVIVAAADSTPDIGFFGTLGYNGTINKDVTVEVDTGMETEDGKPIKAQVTTTTLTGFAAQVENILLADIRIEARQKVDLSKWWSETFVNHTHYGDTSAETHHTGIIAGHAEWATIKDVSVYYSDGVVAFNLPKNTNENTNFYSITGLIGTAVFVNPTYTYDDEGLLSSISIENAVSDKQLLEELFVGGGGTGTGTFTGYMWAYNIFNQHETWLGTQTDPVYQEKYDATEIKTSTGTPYMQSVQVKESPDLISSVIGAIFGTNPVVKEYYYFADSIFTFTMSASRYIQGGSAAVSSEKDYIIKIWNSTSNDDAAPIYVTKSASNGTSVPTGWGYGEVDDLPDQYIYKLTAVDTSKENFMSSGKEYVLGYRYLDGLDENGNVTDNTTDTLYILDVNSSLFVQTFVPYETNTYKTTYIDGQFLSGIQTTYAKGINANHFSSSFIYHSDSAQVISIKSSITNNSLGVKVPPNSILGFDAPQIYVGAESPSEGSGAFSKKPAYWYNWTFSRPTSDNDQISFTKNAITVSGEVSYGSWTTYTSPAAIYFDLISTTFNPVTAQNNISIPNSGKTELLLFEVTQVKKSDNTPLTIPAENIYPTATDKLTFNASKDVLFYDKDNDAYIVTPLAQKKWNDGTGDLLTELNHAVQLYRATETNYSLNFGNLLGDGANFLNTNSGGVVPVKIGTTNLEYTVPTGMIAFYISDADPQSEINIVVAVNPEQAASSIGLYGPRKTTDFAGSIDLKNDAVDSFPLPVSRVASSSANAAKDFINISGYYTSKQVTVNGVVQTQYDFQDQSKSMYTTNLSGEVALVGYTFVVTEPGIYLLGSGNGPMTVCYFSVTGAASAGDDGTGGSPLGAVDFVYDNGGRDANGAATTQKIITVDQKSTAGHIVETETPEIYYYPSYHFIRMLPKVTKPDNTDGKIPYEQVRVRRYLLTSTTQGLTRRKFDFYYSVDGDSYIEGFSRLYQDANSSTLTPTS